MWRTWLLWWRGLRFGFCGQADDEGVQVWVQGREETAMVADWVVDGVDRCRVGIVQKEFGKDADKLNGKLVQVVEFLFDNSNKP